MDEILSKWILVHWPDLYTVLASMEGEKPEANMTFIALQVQIGAVVVYSLMAV